MIQKPAQETIRKAQNGVSVAQAEVFTYLYPQVRKMSAFQMGPDANEDAVQDIMIEIFAALPKFRGESSLKTWAMRIAIRKSIKLRNRARTHSALHPDTLESEVHIDLFGVGAEVAAELSWLSRRLIHLDAKKREAFVLVEVMGFTLQEAADTLGRPRFTIATRVRRAKAWLQSEMKGEVA